MRIFHLSGKNPKNAHFKFFEGNKNWESCGMIACAQLSKKNTYIWCKKQDFDFSQHGTFRATQRSKLFLIASGHNFWKALFQEWRNIIYFTQERSQQIPQILRDLNNAERTLKNKKQEIDGFKPNLHTHGLKLMFLTIVVSITSQNDFFPQSYFAWTIHFLSSFWHKSKKKKYL
jgi:hypothetical protein